VSAASPRLAATRRRPAGPCTIVVALLLASALVSAADATPADTKPANQPADAKPWWDYIVAHHDLLLNHANSDGTGPAWMARAGTDSSGSLDVDGLPRTWDIHLPPAYDGKTPLPLIIALHGGGLSGKVHAYYSGLSDLADREGFIVVYPDGGVPAATPDGDMRKPNVWDAQLNGPEDDVDFLRALLAHLRATYPIAHGEVMVCGLSAGAIMSYRFALEAGDQVDCIASLAGTFIWNKRAGEPKPPATPVAKVSVLAIHGKLDKSVPYDGVENDHVRVWATQRTVTFWAGCDGYAGDPVAERQGDLLTQTWSGNPDGTEVRLITLDQGTHGLPMRPSDAGPIHGSEAIRDFLVRDQACFLGTDRQFSGPGVTVAALKNPRLPPDAALRYSLDGSEPGISAPLLGASLDLSASTTVRVIAFANGKAVGVATTAHVEHLDLEPAQALATAPAQPGLHYAYGEGDFAAIPDLADLHASATGICPTPDLTHIPHRAEHFAIHFDGFLNIAHAGIYTLSLRSDDGSSLSIDGVRAIDNDGLHEALERSRTVALAAGWHAIAIGYLQGTGDCSLAVAIAEPGQEKRLVTPGDFACSP